MKKSFFFLLLTVFISCSDNSTTPDDLPPIWPLDVGNAWLYENSGFDPEGHYSYIFEINVTKDTLIQDEKFYVLRSSPSDMKCYTYRGTDIYSVYHSNGRDIIDVLYQYPGTVGKKFLCWGEYKEIVSKETKIHTREGSFICYHYQVIDEFLNHTFIYDQYLSPSIGLIKEEVTIVNEEGSTIANHNMILIDYEIKEIL